MKAPSYALESDLVAAVERYLASRGDCLITRVEAGGSSERNRRTAAGTADYVGVVLRRVIPDNGRSSACAVVVGVHIELELKRDSGKVRLSQLNRQPRVRQLGGVYEICRSVADVQRAIGLAKGEAP